jgi:Rieske 2Fe-2S family protein
MPVLGVEAYTTQEWFDLEQELLFSRTWQFAGLAEDIAQPGDFSTVQAGRNNMFIVKGRDHRLRAFHNICRHRGTQLLRAAGKTRKAIICPYHDWTYDLEGKLVSVPDKDREFPDLDMSCMGLHKASVDIWRGMLWVHPEPDAGSIIDWFGDIEPYLAPYHPEELVEYEDAATHHEIAANWKIVVENFIDAYHLSHLHAGTLATYDHGRIESQFVGPHFAFYEPLAAHYLEDIERNASMPLVDPSPKDKLGAYVPMLFPNLGLGESESDWSTFHVIPKGPERTVVETRTKVANVSGRAFQKQASRSDAFWRKQIKPKHEGDAQNDPLATADFMEEDKYVCEQQQKSLKSPWFSVGASAHRGEAPVREYQGLIKHWVEGA